MSHPSASKAKFITRLNALLSVSVTLILAFSSFSVSAATTTYEDGSWGIWERWEVMRDRGTTTLTPWFDEELNSSVLAILSGSLSESDTLQIGGLNSLNGWNNQSQTHLSLKLKTQSDFIINVRLLTTNGQRYIRYTNTTATQSSESTINVGLGTDTANGTWQVINRNLQQDLATAESGNTIIAVNGLLVRGTLFIDDISLSDSGDVLDSPTSDVLYQSEHSGSANDRVTGNILTDAHVSSELYSNFFVSSQASNGDARVDSLSGTWQYYPTIQTWSGEDQFSVTASGNGVDPLVHTVNVTIVGTDATEAVKSAELVETSTALSPELSSIIPEEVIDEAARELINNSSTRFVDTKNGANTNSGSQNHPWQTLTYAIGHLNAGQTLLIREGVYSEQNLSVAQNGSSSRVTTIRNYPGELVTIDASDNNLREQNNSTWEIYDENTKTYRTRKSDYGNTVYTGYATTSSGIDIPLVPYISDSSAGARGLNDLVSTEYDVSSKARYVGPGIAIKSGRVYIRLSAVPRASLNADSSFVGFSTNPNDYELTISNSSRVLSLEGKYINVSGINFTGAESGIKLKSDASHIEIKNSSFKVPSTAVLLQDGVHDVSIDSIVVEGNFPDWVAWTDMKGTSDQSTPASYWPMRSAGVNGDFVEDISISNSTFNRVFDGFVLSGKNIEISNNSGEFIDDFVQLGSDSYYVYIHNNTVQGAGPSHYGRGNSAKPGTVFIHDNIIDTRQKHLIGKRDPKNILDDKHADWKSKKPFSSHASSKLKNGNPWKIYQNTIVFNGQDTSGSGLTLWHGINKTSEPHEVYNNIIIETGGGTILKDLNLAEHLQYYDGNIYWQKVTVGNTAIFSGWEDENSSKYNYFSIEEFRNSAEFIKSKKYYKSGWENSGYSGDPLLNSNFSPVQGGIAASGSVVLPSTFHGTSNSYRGALPPE